MCHVGHDNKQGSFNIDPSMQNKGISKEMTKCSRQVWVKILYVYIWRIWLPSGYFEFPTEKSSALPARGSSPWDPSQIRWLWVGHSLKTTGLFQWCFNGAGKLWVAICGEGKRFKGIIDVGADISMIRVEEVPHEWILNCMSYYGGRWRPSLF